ncbi:TIGR02391 family protein [Stenotrophomonas indicatrix]|uniref:TIGR02391 family protein n=1 Tax=Stenotrophomonas indicatrix TaxID=2045451 RepID=UPI000FDCB202|nr:TIGR02391 family protein [Stenotrophomonas indicatrix]
MQEWYFQVANILRDIRKKAWDAMRALDKEDAASASLVKSYISDDYSRLVDIWTSKEFPREELGNLARHIRFGDRQDFIDMLRFDIDFIAMNAEGHARIEQPEPTQATFERLLHPIVAAASLHHYRQGDYRNAVLDAMVALSDLIRSRTGLKEDGKALATQAFSLASPSLIFSELESDSGKNDQKGFMEMIAGAYMGIRNPKAHSLIHDLDVVKAAQYLVTISLLVRRVAEATPPTR